MGISKVIKKHTGEVIVDLTNDTVTAATLAAGRTAHNKYGDIITGTMTAGGIAALPALNNEGTADDLVQGKELIDSDGQIITGTNPYSKAETDEEINTQSMLIDQIMSSLEGKASGGSGSGNVETCTVTFTTAEGYSYIDFIAATIIINGVITPYSLVPNNSNTTKIVVENVLCGSTIVFDGSSNDVASGFMVDDGGGCSFIAKATNTTYIIQAPTIANANGTVFGHPNA